LFTNLTQRHLANKFKSLSTKINGRNESRFQPFFETKKMNFVAWEKINVSEVISKSERERDHQKRVTK
jgi:hypothetical protein